MSTLLQPPASLKGLVDAGAGLLGLGRGEEAKNVRKVPCAGTAPPPRESHTMTQVGGKVFVFGGFDGSRVLNDLYVYDTLSGLWSQLVHTGISPPARAGHSATALGVPAHLVIFGGANSSRRFADVQIFDTTDNHWLKPATRGRPPTPRYYQCACLARNQLIVFGGNDGSNCLADLHALNSETWAWTQPIVNGSPPPPRCGHSGTMVNKLLFIVGGVGDAPNNAHGASELCDVHVLDTESWSWWKPDVSPPLPPIAYHGAALCGDKIFIFGGSTRDALYNDVLMLDTATCAWQVAQSGDAAKLPRRRRLGVSRGAGTRLLTFGGWDGSATCADMWEVDASLWLRIEGPAIRQGPTGAKAKTPAGSTTGATPTGGFGSGGGRGGGGGGGAGIGALEQSFERLTTRQDEEFKNVYGEVARVRMANDMMARQLGKLKSLVGVLKTEGGLKAIDVDELASKREVEELRLEVTKLRRQLAQEREANRGHLHAELDAMKRSMKAMEAKVAGGGADSWRADE